jgi:hypothetical protein
MTQLLSLLIASILLVFLEAAEARALLETTHGKCSRELITVQTTTGMADVKQGQSREFHVSSHRFGWKCGKEEKWTACSNGTTLVVVTRATAGRDISWACYSE